MTRRGFIKCSFAGLAALIVAPVLAPSLLEASVTHNTVIEESGHAVLEETGQMVIEESDITAPQSRLPITQPRLPRY